MLQQAREVNEFDVKIANEIKALHPVAAEDDEIYVRMPRVPNEVVGRWQNFWSGFNTGRANETFWYLYNVDPGVIRFSCTPFMNPGEDTRMQVIVQEWCKHGLTKVYPFYVDDHQHVFPIKKIVLTDLGGHDLKTLDFSQQFKGFAGPVADTQRIPIISLPANF